MYPLIELVLLVLRLFCRTVKLDKIEMYLVAGLALAGSTPVDVAGKAFSLPVWVVWGVVGD